MGLDIAKPQAGGTGKYTTTVGPARVRQYEGSGLWGYTLRLRLKYMRCKEAGRKACSVELNLSLSLACTNRSTARLGKIARV